MKARLRSIIILAIFVVVLVAGIWALPVLVDKSYAAIKDAEEAARIAALPTPHPLEGIFDSEAAKSLGFETMAKGEYADYYFTLNSMDSRFIFIEAAEAMLRYMTDELGMEFVRPDICVYNAEEVSGNFQLEKAVHCDISDFSSCWFPWSKLFGESVPGWYPVALYNYLMADKSGAMTAEDAQKWYEENKDDLPPLSDYWLVPGFFPEADTAFDALMSITAGKFENGLKTYEEIAEAIGFSEDEEIVRISQSGEFRITTDNYIITCDTMVYDFEYITLREGVDNIRSQMDLVREFLKPAITKGFWLYQDEFAEFPPATIVITNNADLSFWSAFEYTDDYNSIYFANAYALDFLYSSRQVAPSLSELYRYGIPEYLVCIVEEMNNVSYDATYMESNSAGSDTNRLYKIYKLVCELDDLDPAYSNAHAMLKAEAIQSLYEYGIVISDSYFTTNEEMPYISSSYADFVRYIYETYGLGNLYRLSYKIADTNKIVGKTMEELVENWKADINYDEIIRLYEEGSAAEDNAD